MLIALDINNVCQLRCNHCYLPPDLKHEVTPKWVLDIVVESRPEEIVVVGMEPLFNRQAREAVQWLSHKHPKVSIITNAMNIGGASDFLGQLENVDISMDAGPAHWNDPHHGRGTMGAPNFETWAEGIRKVRHEVKALTVLNTLTVWNVTPEKIDDMMVGARSIGANSVMFSPFVRVSEQLEASNTNLRTILQALACSDLFMMHRDSVLLVDRYHIDGEGHTYSETEELIRQMGMERKVELLPKYPHKMGIVRLGVTGIAQNTHSALWAPRTGAIRGIQLREGDRITNETITRLNRLFPYRP